MAADPVNIQIMALEETPGQMTLTVSAVDQNGRPFPSLQASNFNVWFNDTALIVRGLQTETARLPASVLLLVDVSGSMAGEPMNQARAAMQQFIDALDAADQVAVMTFAAGVNLTQDFTTDRDALAAAIANLTPGGETALYDGVIQAAAKIDEVQQGRTLVVLLSDGVATVNAGRRAESLAVAHDAAVGFVSVGLGNQIDRQYLAELSQVSGGRVVEASTPAALRQAYTDLAHAIRSQYVLQIEVPRSVDRFRRAPARSTARRRAAAVPHEP
jgi:VWFA-related protein